MRCSLIFLILTFLVLATPQAKAHEDHDQKILNKSHLESENIKELRYLLDKVKELEITQESPLTIELEKELGLKLLDVLENEELTELRKQLPPTVFFRAKNKVKDVLHHWNPVSLGLQLLEGVRRHGLWIGIALASGEVFEKLATTMSITYMKDYPGLSIVPIAMETHYLDFMMFQLAVGIPSYYRLFQIWNQRGGVFNGSREYFETLKKFNQVLGADPSRSFGRILGSNTYLVRDENKLFRPLVRILPQKIRIWIDPRLEALTETHSTITLDKLLSLAEKNKIPIHFLDEFKNTEDPLLYATLLVNELQKKLGNRFVAELKNNTPWLAETSEPWNFQVKVEYLRRNFDRIRKTLFQKAKQEKKLNRALYAKFRELEQLTRNEGALSKLGSSKNSTEEELAEMVEKIQGYQFWIEELAGFFPSLCETTLVKN